MNDPMSYGKGYCFIKRWHRGGEVTGILLLWGVKFDCRGYGYVCKI